EAEGARNRRALLPLLGGPWLQLAALHHARGRTLVRLLENAFLQPPGHVSRGPGGALVLSA
ncbi:mCG145344, partial [Mus musculus]